MTSPRLIEDLKRDEGCKLQAYPDPLSPLAKALRQGVLRIHGLSGDPWTIGYGCTGPSIVEGTVWSQEKADDELQARVQGVISTLNHEIPWWRDLNNARQDVLANMGYNLGWPKLSKFVDTLRLVQDGKFTLAGKAMLESLWARQVGDRAVRLAKQMQTGVWA